MITTKIRSALTITALTSILLCASCSTPIPTGDLAALQSMADSCPQTELVEYLGIDVTPSSQSAEITAARHTAIRSIATQVAVCSGRLHGVAFAGSAAGSDVIFDATLAPAGATPIARMRKVPELIDSTMTTIDTNIASATKALSQAGGSDITAQFSLAAEFNEQMALDGPVQLHVDLLTDGVQSVGLVLNTDALTVTAATDLAQRADVVTLPSTTAVTVAGLGKTAGAPPPTEFTDALKAFYLTYCQRTGAATCVAVTDYTSGS